MIEPDPQVNFYKHFPNKTLQFLLFILLFLIANKHKITPTKPMHQDENNRFKFVDSEDPIENQNSKLFNDKNFINPFPDLTHLSQKPHDQENLDSSVKKLLETSPQQKQKQRKIKKLTNINKHLLQQLKEQNDELSKRVNKQKFRMPKKSQQSLETDFQSVKQSEAIKRELENAYRQIQYYKQTIFMLKAQEMPLNQRQKINDLSIKSKERKGEIERIQQQIQTHKTIKQQQKKQLERILNKEMTDAISKINQQIASIKQKLKDIKKTIVKREELEKKQHTYLIELQNLKKKKKYSSNQLSYEQIPKSQSLNDQHRASQIQWNLLKNKLAIQKKKYEQNGKKLTYYNYIKSKYSKTLEELDLKYKEKTKILDKLKSKLNEVDKLARIVPKPQILERVDLKMSKLKEIISRQNNQLQNQNKIKARIQSEDVRNFKKWQLLHALRDSEDAKFNFKNQSQEERKVQKD